MEPLEPSLVSVYVPWLILTDNTVGAMGRILGSLSTSWLSQAQWESLLAVCPHLSEVYTVCGFPEPLSRLAEACQVEPEAHACAG